MIRPLIAGNWKMNKLPKEAEGWALSFKEKLSHLDLKADVSICAPFTHLLALATIFTDSPVMLGAQDLSQHEAGAYTGEVSAAMLKDIGVRHVIIGHSERRAYHHEDDALLNAKLKQALKHGLIPILCVGESEAQREAGQARAVVLEQLNAGLAGIAFARPEDLVIAYEPIWAIGTGKTATSADAQEMGAAIREVLLKRFPEHASELRLLYGGSMKPGNAKDLLSKPDVNGGLIGGASLELSDFVAIVEAA